MKKALYSVSNDTYALCTLCPHRCHIAPGRSGLCGVRENVQGVLYASSYGRLTALCPTPIEQHRFSRFLPRSRTLAVGSYGCNLACPFCSDSDFSKGSPDYVSADCSDIARMAGERGIPSLTFTRNEPVTCIEFVLDTAKSARVYGVKTAIVTSGYISAEPLRELAAGVDAVCLDVKAWNDIACRRIGGDLQTVKQTLDYCAGKVHLEVNLLLTPGLFCDMQDIANAARYISSIGEIPLHISRYFPAYNYLKAATDPSFMEAAVSVCKKYLKYVYCHFE